MVNVLIRKQLFAISLAVLLMAGTTLAKTPAKAAAPTAAECLGCHSDASLTKEVNGKQVSLQVKEENFKNSIHGQMFQCADCHKDVSLGSHPGNPVAKVECAQCHDGESKAYANGLHAKAIASGNTQAARCVDCHGNIHEVLPSSDPKSKVNHANIAATCGACHGQKFVMQSAGLPTAPVTKYQESVHGKAVAGGSQKAAVCSDCHGAHEIRNAGDPQSPIFKNNVATTCAKCHGDEKAEFVTSIHGQALAKGNLHSAACTDCHGIHGIRKPTDPASSVNAQNLATETCAQCHQNNKLSSEFGMAGDRAKTYFANYHGMAKSMGSKTVATCASCHGFHGILPADNPKSRVNPANLAKTCGECHPGASASFVSAKIHSDPKLQAADIGTKVVAFVRMTYIGLIFGTIGFMLLHNLIVLRKKLVDRRDGHVHHAALGPRVVVRMTKLQRIQHALLFTTFFTLVLTGFALKYPDSWLASLFVNEAVRSIVHRIAGALMIVTSFYHVWYLARTDEGRRMFLDMLPELKDARDIVQVFLYYLGLSSEKPQFKRFNYAEKMEYWALVWGTIVMAVTGLMAWLKVPVGNLLPRWTIDVGLTVHFYEAILATLAILVWHFYMIIFDPDVYPMNWAWYDGKMTLEQYREEHSLDGQTIAEFMAEPEAEEEVATESKETAPVSTK
jgi:cytochrome b subunit of formate dehydrogenase